MLSKLSASVRQAPDDMGWLTVSAQERTTHPVAIAETGQARDDVDWMASVLQQRAGSLQPQVLDCLRWSQTRFRQEDSIELA